MSLNPYAHTIHTLNTDILSYIFALNAHMFSDIEALTTTRVTAQVCQNWRNIMLATPSLWARLIDMDTLSERWNIQWGNELIQRSGAALLWIRAEWVRLSTDIAEFLLRIIGENWHRIQILSVQDQSIVFDSKLTRLAFGVPAPHLETFDVTFDHTAVSKDNEGTPILPLFAGNAPMLRRFHVYAYSIDQWEPWLSQLHSLELDSTYNGRDVLAVLAATPSLQELLLYTQDNDCTPPSLPIISLPHLKSLECNGLPHPCITLLDHIDLPLGCSLTISIAKLSEDLNLEETEEQIFSVVDAFNRYARRFPQSNIFQIVHIVCMPDRYISMTGEATFPVGCRYKLRFSFNKKHTSNQLSTTLSRLALLDFSRTTTLRFNSHGPLDPLFFSCFSSLDTLSVDERSLEYIMDGQDNINDTEQPHMLFPFLKVLDMNTYHSAVQIEVVVKFILSRMQNGHPIATLDMTKCAPFNPAPNLDALSEGKGLRVLYKLAEMDGKFEFICGSGDPARDVVTI